MSEKSNMPYLLAGFLSTIEPFTSEHLQDRLPLAHKIIDMLKYEELAKENAAMRKLIVKICHEIGQVIEVSEC